MTNQEVITAIRSKESPRDILAADFKSLGGPLPIRGGWGYSFEDACVIDKEMHLAKSAAPFDVVSIERIFVEKRIYEELIIFRPENDRYHAISWELLRQALIEKDDNLYDVLSVQIFATHDNFITQWGGPKHASMDTQNPGATTPENTPPDATPGRIFYQREYWFNVTSNFR